MEYVALEGGKELDLSGRDIVSIRDLTKEEIIAILERAEKALPVARGERGSRALEGKILATLFYEPSTRTRLSFESAMLRLGGSVIGFAEVSGASVAKGETLADTVRMAESYADVIVLRHPHEGAARLAADFSSKPVINAGDGAGQHPTQTLLDLFTIKMEKGDIAENNVVLVGDLKYGRTVHSLSYALSLFGASVTCVAPPSLQMPPEIVSQLRQMGARFNQSDSLESVISGADVLYVTRIQRERFPDPEEYRKVENAYRIDNSLLANAKKSLIVLHPLPRLAEIAPEVDNGPHARYFKQAFYGVPVRMALLSMILGKEEV
ncbi:MAG: aspartate carbamoyltransferase [Thermoplasmata archaeon]